MFAVRGTYKSFLNFDFNNTIDGIEKNSLVSC